MIRLLLFIVKRFIKRKFCKFKEQNKNSILITAKLLYAGFLLMLELYLLVLKLPQELEIKKQNWDLRPSDLFVSKYRKIIVIGQCV